MNLQDDFDEEREALEAAQHQQELDEMHKFIYAQEQLLTTLKNARTRLDASISALEELLTITRGTHT